VASQQELLQQCLEEGERASRPALGRCLDQAIAALQTAETLSFKLVERDALATAWQLLHRLKPVWLDRYPIALRAAFSESAELAENAAQAGDLDTPVRLQGQWNHSGPAALHGGRRPDAFTLVDDADVVQAIASGRLLQRILPRVDVELATLDALISSTQGLVNVRPELNPLRPDVFVRVLQAILVSAGAEEAVFAHWVRCLAEPLGHELRLIYGSLIERLEGAHVQAAQYRMLPTSPEARTSLMGDFRPAAGAAQAPGYGSRNEPPAPPQYADMSNYEIRDDLFQEFLSGSGSKAHQGLAPAYYESVDKELAALKAAPDLAAAPLAARPDTGQNAPTDANGDGFHSDSARASGYQQQDAVDRPARQVDASGPLSSAVWGAYGRSRERVLVRTQLKKQATQVGQVLGLEVVRQLVSQVALDPRLLAPVREAIVALEPSLLRLAMVDTRFFSDESHAGRQLMERVAQQSFKYNDEFSPEFETFFQPVCKAFNALNNLAIEGSKPFREALVHLQASWDAQDEQALQRQRVVLQALRFAEERQDAADQIAHSLSARSDLQTVPGAVLDFLFGPWALAMAHARLVDERNQIDPQGFGSVVPDLLWSVKPDVTLKRPAKLIDMIPGLIDKLKAGLAMLGQDPNENESFFDCLMTMHQPVLRLRRLKTQRDAEESGAVPLEALMPVDTPATFHQRQAQAAEQPWLGRDELDAAGFEDTQPTAPAQLAALEAEMERSWHQQQAIEQAQPVADAAPAGLPDQASSDLTPSSFAEGHPLSGPGLDARTPNDCTQLSGIGSREGHLPDAAVPAHGEKVGQEAEEQIGERAEATLRDLRAGHWVDLYSKRRWLRAQLIWASSKGTLFMFVSSGGQPHSMTKRSCEKLIGQRLLRPVDTHGVVAQAMVAVAQDIANLPAAAPPVPATFPQNQPASN